MGVSAVECWVSCGGGERMFWWRSRGCGGFPGVGRNMLANGEERMKKRTYEGQRGQMSLGGGKGAMKIGEVDWARP